MTKLIVRRPNYFNHFADSFGFPSLFTDNLFQDFHKTLNELTDKNTGYLSVNKGFPKGDVYFDNGNAVIELALAGYSKDQLSVKVDGDKIVVSASKQEDEETTGSRTLARRAFTKEFHNVADEWDLLSAEVTYKDGLLRVVVPRVEPKPEPEPEPAIELEIK